MQGLGEDFDTGTGVFRRPKVDGGGVFNQVSGLGSTASTTAQFVGAAVVAGAITYYLATKKKRAHTPNRRRARRRKG
jgi:hypothetical protein